MIQNVSEAVVYQGGIGPAGGPRIVLGRTLVAVPLALGVNTSTTAGDA